MSWSHHLFPPAFNDCGQLVDDVLDYEEGECTLGKPGGADLKLGLTTAPALYAWEEHAAMGPLIKRNFDQEGDVELVSRFPFETPSNINVAMLGSRARTTVEWR
jgi:geranylgeranyl pyrophosphate synthase